MINTKTNKFCQSCGMPMSKDPKNGGTNSNGSINNLYCSYCYQNGAFTFNGTLKEMQAHCKVKMIEQGMPKWLAWLFTLGMNRLERWKK
jgi:hypothetical protein